MTLSPRQSSSATRLLPVDDYGGDYGRRVGLRGAMLGPEWEGEPPGEPPWKSGRIPVSGSAGASPSQALRQIHAQSFDGGRSGGPAPTPNTEHWHLSSYRKS